MSGETLAAVLSMVDDYKLDIQPVVRARLRQAADALAAAQRQLADAERHLSDRQADLDQQVEHANSWQRQYFAQYDKAADAERRATEKDAIIAALTDPDTARTFNNVEDAIAWLNEPSDEIKAQLTAQAETLRRMREALARYGTHLWSCHTRDGCDCGYAALADTASLDTP